MAAAAGVVAAAAGGDGIPATAQLKMLKTLQQEINERTESFDELRRRNQKLTPEQTAEPSGWPKTGCPGRPGSRHDPTETGRWGGMIMIV